MALLRIFLFPVSLLYGLVAFLRNKLFDWNVLRPVTFAKPVISIGNLSVGGTGKTPHVCYLVELLGREFRVATLSRGYKRSSKGFLIAGDMSSARDVGDEAYLYRRRYPGITVAVDERRVHGISSLIEKVPGLEVVLLDDAFQHRWVRPGLSLLLTDFYHLYSKDHPLPSGRLREFRFGARRADAIVVTKTPRVLSPITRQRVVGELKPRTGQRVYFSYIDHGPLTQIPGVDFAPSGSYGDHTALLFAGIANPYPLEHHLKTLFAGVQHAYFPDHHMYTVQDIEETIRSYDKIFTSKKVIVTTEKDMMRLIDPDILVLIRHLPVCYVPMNVRFHDEDRDLFDNEIRAYVKDH